MYSVMPQRQPKQVERKSVSKQNIFKKLEIAPTDKETILATHNSLVPTMEHFNSVELGHF